MSEIPDGPSIVGWFRPAILLPAATILNLTPDQLEAILAHEMAHLRRYDDVVNIAQSVIETLLFYHPAVWWVSGRIRHERELCCDDLAVRASGDALGYARALTALETLRVMPAGLVLGAATSPLEYRIRRIVGAPQQNALPSSLPGLLALGLALISVAVYSTPASGSAPDPPAHLAYPESARVNGIEGTVPVEVKVDDQGNVSHATAIGGPRELRQAAVESASAMHFAPDDGASAKQVNVSFQLELPAQTPAPPAVVATASLGVTPMRTGPRWVDQGEANIGLAAANETDSLKRLELLKQWEQLYPVSELKAQRSLLMARALLAVLNEAYGKTDPAVLSAARQAALQLADHFDEYLDDSVRPATLTAEEWAETRRTSELQIHNVLAYIAQANGDGKTAEAELRRVLVIDPEQASASYQLGLTIADEIGKSGNTSRYPEAIDHLTCSLAVTGPSALTPAVRIEAENALNKTAATYRELSAPVPQAHAAWAAAHPDLDLWERTKIALLERGDSYFASMHESDGDNALPVLRATVISQLSANRILVNVDDARGDAVLRLDAPNIAAVRPGTPIEFRGVIDSYTRDPYVLTFVIRNPKDDLVWLGSGTQKHRSVLVRVFKGFSRLIGHLA
jgi:TonB family protein